MNIEQYKAEALKDINHYQSDIDIDIDIINGLEDGEYALFFTNDCGSHSFIARNKTRYPSSGEKTRYLFGFAYREQILESETDVFVNDTCKIIKNAISAFIAYSPDNIKRIKKDSAPSIVSDYRRKMEREFKLDTNQHMVSA